jgi:hypothetical protein
MAIQTRYVGDSLGINNVDNTTSATGVVVATGLTKNPLAIKVLHANVGVAGEMVTGGAVETILRAIAQDSTIVMYQVDAGQISLLLEASGAGGVTGTSQYGADVLTIAQIATGLQTRLVAIAGATAGTAGPTGAAIGGNIGISANVCAFGITVTSAGFKLA